MEKILVEIKVPAANIVYDIFVPESMQVGTMTQLVASAFSKLSDGVYGMTKDSVLCNQLTGRIYDSNLRIYETEIRNGTKLFLY